MQVISKNIFAVELPRVSVNQKVILIVNESGQSGSEKPTDIML
jgi:hypothetical protein